MKKIMSGIIVSLICLIVISNFNNNVNAKELTFSGEIGSNKTKSDVAYIISYRNLLSSCIGVEISYLNEGHIENSKEYHHRDGFSFQMSYLYPFSKNITLRSSLGPYLAFDTTSHKGEKIKQEVGALVSLEGDYYFTENIFGILRGNIIAVSENPTISAMMGIGYAFKNNNVAKKKFVTNLKKIAKNEISLYVGTSIPNVKNHSGKNTSAYMVGIKHNFTPYFDIATLLINEGNTNVYNRRGIALEPQLVANFGNHISLGIGAGIYFNNESIDKMVSICAGYKIFPKLDTLFRFSRIIATKNRDSDIFMFGIGYRF